MPCLFLGVRRAALGPFLGAGVMDYLEGLRVLLGQHLLSLGVADRLVDLALQLIVLHLLAATAGRLALDVFSADYFFETFFLPRFLVTLTPIEFGHL